MRETFLVNLRSTVTATDAVGFTKTLSLFLLDLSDIFIVPEIGVSIASIRDTSHETLWKIRIT